MLQVPMFTQVGGVSVFPDDTVFSRFYLVAREPGIRLDERGDPIFLLVKYAFSDEDRRDDPSLPAGGGQLSLDASFEVTAGQQDRVRAELQPLVDAEWARLRAGTPEEQARQGVAGTIAPPAVELASPTWTSGKVRLHAPKAAELVQATVAEGEPSLLAGNVAMFNLGLTDDGADLLHRVLTDPDGSGAGDLVPLQVGYDLTCWARLPAVGVHVRVDARKVHEYVRKQLDGRGIGSCTGYELAQADLTGEAVALSGVVDVQVDTGSGSVPDAVVAQLRDYALEMVKRLMESRFFDHGPPDQGFRRAFRPDFDQATMRLDLELQQRSVVEWPIHPQATLRTYFAGRTAEEMRRFIRVHRLDDPFYGQLRLTVRAFTDFEVVESVEVEVEYAGRDETGARQVKHTRFTLTSSAPQTWEVGLIGRERSYRYRVRVGFPGRRRGPFGGWVTSRSPDLNLHLPSPGTVDVSVVCGDVDFADLVDSVQVRLAYQDLERGVARQEHTIVLDATRREGRYQRKILEPVRNPVRYRTRFKLRSGEVREDGDWHDAAGPQILVNQSFGDLLRVTLAPSGDGWDDLLQAMVDLRHRGRDGHPDASETIVLTSREESRSWRVLLDEGDSRDFEFRWTAVFRDGRLVQVPWRSSADEQVRQTLPTLPIHIASPGIKVVVLADLLDFQTCPLTEVTLRYDQDGTSDQETFVFRDKTPQVWRIDAPDGAPVDLTYQVTHTPADGDPVTLPPARELDTVIVLPRYRAGRPGPLTVQVIGTLVDFAATPTVLVDLAYPGHEAPQQSTFLTLDQQHQHLTWTVQVKDLTVTGFDHQITYLGPGRPAHQTGWVREVVPRVVVQPHQPQQP
jgi:hypothetical protein